MIYREGIDFIAMLARPTQEVAVSFVLDLIRGGHVSIMRVPPSECAVFSRAR